MYNKEVDILKKQKETFLLENNAFENENKELKLINVNLQEKIKNIETEKNNLDFDYKEMLNDFESEKQRNVDFSFLINRNKIEIELLQSEKLKLKRDKKRERELRMELLKEEQELLERDKIVKLLKEEKGVDTIDLIEKCNKETNFPEIFIKLEDMNHSKKIKKSGIKKNQNKKDKEKKSKTELNDTISQNKKLSIYTFKIFEYPIKKSITSNKRKNSNDIFPEIRELKEKEKLIEDKLVEKIQGNIDFQRLNVIIIIKIK